MSVLRDHAIPAAGTQVLAVLAALGALSVLGVLGAQEAQAQQIVLTSARNLEFGRFVAGSGGTVVLSPLGLRSRTGGVVLLSSAAAGQAMFNISRSNGGASNKAVIISLPANGSIRLNSGANSMAVNGFVSNPASLSSLPNGGATLSVGASLVVAPNQPPGNYSGSFPVTVNFQ